MFAKLPPLLGLRAFESAARLGSFKDAAKELSVTPAAVGSQVRALEDRLGVRLFRRFHRKVETTAAALILQQACHQAFSTLTTTIESIRPEDSEQTLTIGVGTVFASRWLSPRLSRFWMAHPEIALRLNHTPTMTEADTFDTDAVIAWGNGAWENFNTIKLLKPKLVPVASPEYLATYGRPSNTQDLRHHILVHEIDDSLWQNWFINRNENFVKSTANTSVRDGVLAVQLALDGQAIALAVEEFMGSEFASGVLEKLFESNSSGGVAYYLAIPDARGINRSLSIFCDWIKDEVSKTDGFT